MNDMGGADEMALRIKRRHDPERSVAMHVIRPEADADLQAVQETIVDALLHVSRKIFRN